MGLLNTIQKLRLRQELPIREFERRNGLSRNTIKKYLKADAIEPKFATPERPSKLDPFAEKLAHWLKTNAGRPRKERPTRKKMRRSGDAWIHPFLQPCSGLCTIMRADRQREQQTTGRDTFVLLAFRPGKAFQFDWSEDFAVVGGDRLPISSRRIALKFDSKTYK